MEGQSLFQAALANGNYSPEEEINRRQILAGTLVQQYERGGRGNVLYLRSAIEQYEAILRRLPQDSPKRPEHLTRLSYVWLSDYMATKSSRALDEAVRTGRLAREKAITLSLDQSDGKLYGEILNNCGVALSYRSENANAVASRAGSTAGQSSQLHRGRAEADLDEAIECARDLKKYTAEGSPDYARAISNLASRRMRRNAMSENEADRAEVVKLLQELQSISQPGSQERAGAITLLSQLAVDKFNKSGTLEDLDRALGQLKESITSFPEAYEGKQDVYKQTKYLYRYRYRKTNDAADLRLAVQYSESSLSAVPDSHAVKDGFLLDHLHLLREYLNVVNSIPQIELAILTAGRYVANMRKNDTKQLNCRRLSGDILGRAYILSQRPEDIVKAMNHIEQVGYDYNSQAELSGDTAPVDTQLLCSIAVSARYLTRGSPGQARDSGLQKLYEHIHRQCQSADFINDLLRTDKHFLELLKVYADATQAREPITDSQAKIRADEAHAKKQKELQERLERPRWKPKEYNTELGLRQLAIDPTNKQIVMDMRGLMGNIFGYDPDKPIRSKAELVAKEQQIEADSIAKAKAKGQHPNPKLCYMCRYIKILQPTTVDLSTTTRSRPNFEWNSRLWLPFGTWNQLTLRTKCSICKLILSLIVADQANKKLYPRLAMIDPEIQGTQLQPVQLSSGEMVLQVEYGMRPVGQIRMASHLNHSQALRQGWEDGGYPRPPRGKMSVNQVEAPQSPSMASPQNESHQQINVNTLKVWLRDCDNNHGEPCNGMFYESEADSLTVDNVPLVLIDVVRCCLVESTSAQKYFALSYVWGKVDMLPTLVANFEARQETGGLNGLAFPKTISDAIKLVEDFGETYLWIDALCIVQDDKTQKTRDIENMNVVYSKAFATIVALHGTDADAGLPGVRPRTRPPQKVETLIIKAGSEDLDYESENDGAVNTDNVEITLVATSPALHLSLEASWWDSRGWTFQERLLSRRCLYFSENYVYFQCGQRDLILSECGINERILNDRDYSAREPKVSITTTLDNPLSELGMSLIDRTAEQKRVATFKAYSSLVDKYTRRQLTYDSDIVNAFMGTFKALEPFQGQVLCGLPLLMLDLALLWTPCGRTPRRGLDLDLMRAQAEEQGRPLLNQLLPTNRGSVLTVYGPSTTSSFDKSVDRRFPSWSWVGWKGAVEYRFFADAFPKERHPTPLTLEYVTNVDGTQLLITKDFVQERTIVESGSNTSAASATSSSNPVLSNPVPELGALNLSGSGNKDTTWILAPTLPNVLQFKAPAVPLTAFTISQEYEYISLPDQIHVSTRQAVRHILDRNGKRCGLWWEQAGYVYVGRGVSPEAEKKMLLVGISRNEDTFKAREGPKRVEGEIRLFDDEVYPAVGKGSALVNVMAVDMDMGHDYMERVTVARIHVKAWEDALPKTRMIMLA